MICSTIYCFFPTINQILKYYSYNELTLISRNYPKAFKSLLKILYNHCFTLIWRMVHDLQYIQFLTIFRKSCLIILLVNFQLMDKKAKENSVMDGILTYLLTLASTQNVLQSIKEVLTLHSSFNPFTLFNYISQNLTAISKEHIIDFLAENGISVSQELVKIFLNSNGFKDKLCYNEFLNYVYPMSAQVLREISTHQIKKYAKTQKIQINEQVLCCFLMLLDQEVEFIKTFEDLKKQQPIVVNRDKLKKIFKVIRKASEKQSGIVTELSGENIITHSQLRSFIKLYHKVQDHEMLNLGRRLSMGKEGIIGLEEFEFWLKPWKKQKSPEEDNLNINSFTNSRKKNNQSRSQRKPSFQVQQTEQFATSEECFIKYIQKFLATNKSIDDLKAHLFSKADFDIMTLFKKIDKKSCGVICKEDIEQIYNSVVGQPLKNVELLITRFSSGRGVISFSQLSQIFRCPPEESKLSSHKSSIRPISNATLKIALDIIRVSVESQQQLECVLQNISKTQIKNIFQRINMDGNGFISYQQIKSYLGQNGMQLPMGDLMAILKRFDRNKNGVIVEEDFMRVLSV